MSECVGPLRMPHASLRIRRLVGRFVERSFLEDEPAVSAPQDHVKEAENLRESDTRQVKDPPPAVSHVRKRPPPPARVSPRMRSSGPWRARLLSRTCFCFCRLQERRKCWRSWCSPSRRTGLWPTPRTPSATGRQRLQ